MKDKIIIGIDIDNILNNLTEVVLKVYNEDSGDNLSVADITEYNMTNFVKPEYRKDFYKYFSDERVVKELKSVDIQRLIDTGCDIYVISATHPYNTAWKYDWVSQHYPQLSDYKKFIFTANKQLVKVDILIDDCLDNVLMDGRLNIVYSYAWNQQLQLNCYGQGGLVYADTYEEIYKTVEEYCNERNN